MGTLASAEVPTVSGDSELHFGFQMVPKLTALASNYVKNVKKSNYLQNVLNKMKDANKPALKDRQKTTDTGKLLYEYIKEALWVFLQRSQSASAICVRSKSDVQKVKVKVYIYIYQ